MTRSLLLDCDYGQSVWWHNTGQPHQSAVDTPTLPVDLEQLVDALNAKTLAFDEMDVMDPNVPYEREQVILMGQAVGACMALWSRFTYGVDTCYRLSHNAHSYHADYVDIVQHYTPDTALLYTKQHPITYAWVEAHIEDVGAMYQSWVKQLQTYDQVGVSTDTPRL